MQDKQLPGAGARWCGETRIDAPVRSVYKENTVSLSMHMSLFVMHQCSVVCAHAIQFFNAAEGSQLGYKPARLQVPSIAPSRRFAMED